MRENSDELTHHQVVAFSHRPDRGHAYQRPLTSMDRALVSLVVEALFDFENPIDQLTETIRRTFFCALVAYYLMGMQPENRLHRRRWCLRAAPCKRLGSPTLIQ